MALLAVTGHPLTLGDVGAPTTGRASGQPGGPRRRARRPGRPDDGRVDVAHDLIREAVGAPCPTGARDGCTVSGAVGRAGGGRRRGSILEALDHLQAGAPRRSRWRCGWFSPQAPAARQRGLSRLVAVADEAATGTLPDDTLFALLGELASKLGAHEEAYRILAGRPSVGRSDAVVARGGYCGRPPRRRHSPGTRMRASTWTGRGPTPSKTTSWSAEVLTRRPSCSATGTGYRRTPVTAARALEMVRAHVGWAGIERVGVDTRRAWIGAAHAAMEGALTSDDPEQMLALAEEPSRCIGASFIRCTNRGIRPTRST